jgi:hypothetical protein
MTARVLTAQMLATHDAQRITHEDGPSIYLTLTTLSSCELKQMGGKRYHISYIKDILSVLAGFIGYLTPVWTFDAYELTRKAVGLSG